MQKYTSKDTSLNQVPSLAKYLEIDANTILLDYGCGKYSKFQDLVESKGGTYFGYDPYWKTFAENGKALKSNPNIITCANVLNVVMEDWIVENIVRTIASYNCEAVFSVYEGNKTGVGSQTKKGYQRNQKANAYMELLTKYYDNIVKKGNVFFCKN